MATMNPLLAVSVAYIGERMDAQPRNVMVGAAVRY
jgi:hypothetical protein